MIKNLNLFLDKKDFIYLSFLVLLILISSLVELIGIASIPIFLTAILDSDKISKFIPELSYQQFYFGDVIIFFGLALLLVFIFKNSYLFFVSYTQNKFFKDLRIRNSDKLLKFYFNQPYIFFLNNDPSILLRSLSSDLDLANNYIEANLNILRELILIVFIFLLLLFTNNNIAILIFLSIGIISVTLFKLFKKKLSKFAQINFLERAEQIKIVNQIFFNISDIKILLKENFFLKKFNKNIVKIKNTEFFNIMFSRSPRLIFETMAVFAMVLIIIIFQTSGQNVKDILPLLSLLGMAALRLIPSFNILTVAFSVIKKSEFSFNSISSRINSIKNVKLRNSFNNNLENKINKIDKIKKIEIRGLSFQYPKSKKILLEDINLKFENNTSIGFIGKTGCGKSTLIKLITGLLEPTKGKILVNGLDINENKISWYQNFSYIPQNIFLYDESIKKNIAFGLEEKDIDEFRLKNAVQLSGLEKFTMNLPNKLETKVGAQGLRLSGGQVQRVGIARALYFKSDLIIMDEATSSLDQKTERDILNDFYNLKNNRFLIMISHRLNSLSECDVIYFIEDGKIRDKGKIDELLKKYPKLQG